MLFAANNTTIPTYGTTQLTLDIGIQKKIQWNFIVAKTKHNIIGTDFLKFYNLTVDVKNGRIIDSQNNIFFKLLFY